MSLLALIAAHAAGGGGDPDPPADPGLPYAIPTAFPYNAPVYSDSPTPDGTGAAIHPTAWDFGPQKWNGWRYWMANTPFYESDITQENPCVWVSDNGFDWEVPAGGRNPIYPTPGGGLFFSDTDIHYDAANDELLLIFRGPNETIYMASSSDGITWPATYLDTEQIIVQTTGNMFLSPSLVHAHDGSWRMYGHYGSSGISFFTAPDPWGPWTYGSAVSVYVPRHSHTIYDPALGLYVYSGGESVATSLDGVTFGNQAKPLGSHVSSWPGKWEKKPYYKTCAKPVADDPTMYQMWYSNTPDVTEPTSYYTAYTRFPKSILPAPGGAAP